MNRRGAVMESMFIRALFGLIFSFLITFYLVPFFCALAMKLRFVDEPDGKIKVHTRTTPYLGGVAVYVGFLSGLALVYPFENSIFLLLLGVTLLVFVGLIDDLIALQPTQKFFGQIVATLCFLKAGLHLKEQFMSSWVNLILSFFWIAGVINAFNLIDVMDGLASTVAIMICLNLMIIAYALGQPLVFVLLSPVLGAVLAFLWYNKPVARIYLGDAGSLFLGGLLSVVPFLINWATFNYTWGFLTPIIVFAIPLLEITALIVVRSAKGIPFYLGSPDHFSSYLRARGWSVQAILTFVFTCSLTISLSSILFVLNKINFWHTTCIAAIFLSVWVGVVFSKKPIFQIKRALE
jgi:UDP-GlcNAc:undecaprenyl-phosphate GlcNAc-1-phosphate transferase